jgi:hypothetical protein
MTAVMACWRTDTLISIWAAIMPRRPSRGELSGSQLGVGTAVLGAKRRGKVPRRLVRSVEERHAFRGLCLLPYGLAHFGVLSFPCGRSSP